MFLPTGSCNKSNAAVFLYDESLPEDLLMEMNFKQGGDSSVKGVRSGSREEASLN
jgi:hypothetical protein